MKILTRRSLIVFVSLVIIGLGSMARANLLLMGVGGSGGGGGLDPATSAWVTAAGGSPAHVSAGRVTVVDTFIKCVKSANLWGKLDRYWLLAGEDQTSALVDMVNLQSATVTGTPTFTASKGYVTSASNFVETNYVPSSGVQFLQNSAAMGAFINTPRTTGTNVYDLGSSDAGFTVVTALSGMNSGNSAVAMNNGGSGADLFTNSGNARGSWIGTRVAASGAGAESLYFNSSTASPGGTAATASAGRSTASILVGGFSQGGTRGFYSGDQISTIFFGGDSGGGGWNSTQVSAFDSCQNAMLTSIAVLP
jgi:hypothetical protein